jgi:hypothetical protein
MMDGICHFPRAAQAEIPAVPPFGIDPDATE